MAEPVRIKIDFSTGRHAKVEGPLWVVVCVCAAAAVFSFFNVYSYVVNASFIADNNELASGAEIPSGAELERLKAESATVNSILEKRMFSWVELFTRLEDTVPEGVSLSQVTPDFSTGELRLKGEAKSIDKALLLVERLNSSGSFSGAFLLEHHYAQVSNTHVIGFDIKAVYGGGK